MLRSTTCIGLALAALLTFAQAASATFPGRNGKLAFATDSGPAGIWVANPDGSGLERLGSGGWPVWSRDGSRIALSAGGISIMNADGSGRRSVSTAQDGAEPAWSPNGSQIVFSGPDDDTGRTLYVVNEDGSGRRRLVSGPIQASRPDWSPDGGRIVFSGLDADEEEVELYTVSPLGTGRTAITSQPGEEACASWSPDGTRIAFTRVVPVGDETDEDLFAASIWVMSAGGGGATRVATGLACAVWSPDGQKLAAAGHPQVVGDPGVFVMNADGSGRTLVPGTAALRPRDVDWQPVECRAEVRVGQALAKGCFVESSAGVFETNELAWVGGFEIRPRPGGRLVVDTGSPELRSIGAGVDVMFGEYAVPIPVGALPVGLPNADVQIGTGAAGSATMLLDLPVKDATAKVAWADGGASATFEVGIAIDKLAGPIGRLVSLRAGEGVGETGGKLAGRLTNGSGFALDQAEVSIAEINVIPDRLRVPKLLKLRNVLLRYERRDEKPFWTGRAGIELPVSGRDLAVTGTAYAFDGSLAGLGLEVDGINRLIPKTPLLFLQSVGGDVLLAPEPGSQESQFSFDLRIGGSLGPRIAGAQLLGITGAARHGTFARGCTRGPDPTELALDVSFKPLDPLEELNLARADLNGTACLYATDSPALELIQRGRLEWLAGLFVISGSHSGYISRTGASLSGNVSLTLPALPDVAGEALISTRGLAACGTFSFAQAGFGYRWGQRAPQTFAGCDLAPFQAPTGASAGAAAARSVGVRVPRGLPHAAFRITAARGGAPRVRLTGPGRTRIASPPGGALRTRRTVIVPAAHEHTTYVLVRRPRPGRWTVRALDSGTTIRRVALARGLPKPKVTARVRKAGKRRRLSYTVRQLPGQRVVFHERGGGVARALGRARGRRGRIVFKPARAKARRRTVEAEVIQNGLPRARLTVARYTAAAPRRPAKPRVKVRRTKAKLGLSWRRVAGASGYLVTVRQGGTALHDLYTRKRRVAFTGTPPTGRLTVTVQALSDVTPPSRVAKRKVKPPR